MSRTTSEELCLLSAPQHFNPLETEAAQCSANIIYQTALSSIDFIQT